MALVALASGWGNSVTMMATITEAERAPPMPWTKRAATKRAWLVGRPARDGGEGEQADAGEEDLLSPDQVAQASRHEEEAAEGDEVGVDHPGQAGLAEVQAASGCPAEPR